MTAARRRVIAELCPEGPWPIVDVGADHGHVAHALGAIATERHPRRIGRRDVRWVVADGLTAFRRVGVAVIAGMGAVTISKILTAGPLPEVAVLHAQDDPPALRRWLAAHGWRLDAERLAPEAGRYAEIIRAVPGHEPASGLELDFGPRLLEGQDPLILPHLEQLAAYHAGLAARLLTADPARHAAAQARAAFLTNRIAALQRP